MAADPARAFLGVGWFFPPRFEAGRIAEAEYEEDSTASCSSRWARRR